MADFNNPQSGTLGGGMAQNAGSQLNWRAAYQQYSIDEQTEGRAPMPMQEFVRHMSDEAQRRQQQGQPIIPQQQPGAGLPGGLGPGPQAPVHPGPQRGGLMDSIRGLFR